MKHKYAMNKTIKTISIGGLTLVTVMLITGCGARPNYPKPIVFGNGVTYNPTWDGYNECMPFNDRPNAECYVKNSDGTPGPVVKILEPDIRETMESFIKNSSNIMELCNKVNRLKLFPDYNSPNSCENHVLKQLHLNAETYSYSYPSDYEKAYQIGLIDKKRWLIYQGRILEAYQTGLIDKDTARTKMLAWGQIVEAYEAKFIDKDTADLYLKQKQIRDATIASQQQTAAAKKAAEDAAHNQRMLQISQGTDQAIQNMQIQNQNFQLQQINNNLKAIRYGY